MPASPQGSAGAEDVARLEHRQAIPVTVCSGEREALDEHTDERDPRRTAKLGTADHHDQTKEEPVWIAKQYYWKPGQLNIDVDRRAGKRARKAGGKQRFNAYFNFIKGKSL